MGAQPAARRSVSLAAARAVSSIIYRYIASGNPWECPIFRTRNFGCYSIVTALQFVDRAKNSVDPRRNEFAI
jgi:hypothetical protein